MRGENKKSPPWKSFAFLAGITLELFLAVSPLRAKDPPQASPTPDPALELSPSQDRAVQQINDYFDQNEKPIRATLKTAQDEYNLALKAKPVDQSTLQAKAAAVQKATALLESAEALHRANVWTLLTPAQKKMVTTLELTGKVPGEKSDSKAKGRGQ
jgi:Spy/CpxP family protein refolding chaperone